MLLRFQHLEALSAVLPGCAVAMEMLWRRAGPASSSAARQAPRSTLPPSQRWPLPSQPAAAAAAAAPWQPPHAAAASGKPSLLIGQRRSLWTTSCAAVLAGGRADDDGGHGSPPLPPPPPPPSGRPQVSLLVVEAFAAAYPVARMVRLLNADAPLTGLRVPAYVAVEADARRHGEAPLAEDVLLSGDDGGGGGSAGGSTEQLVPLGRDSGGAAGAAVGGDTSQQRHQPPRTPVSSFVNLRGDVAWPRLQEQLLRSVERALDSGGRIDGVVVFAGRPPPRTSTGAAAAAKGAAFLDRPGRALLDAYARVAALCAARRHPLTGGPIPAAVAMLGPWGGAAITNPGELQRLLADAGVLEGGSAAAANAAGGTDSQAAGAQPSSSSSLALTAHCWCSYGYLHHPVPPPSAMLSNVPRLVGVGCVCGSCSSNTQAISNGGVGGMRRRKVDGGSSGSGSDTGGGGGGGGGSVGGGGGDDAPPRLTWPDAAITRVIELFTADVAAGLRRAGAPPYAAPLLQPRDGPAAVQADDELERRLDEELQEERERIRAEVEAERSGEAARDRAAVDAMRLLVRHHPGAYDDRDLWPLLLPPPLGAAEGGGGGGGGRASVSDRTSRLRAIPAEELRALIKAHRAALGKERAELRVNQRSKAELVQLAIEAELELGAIITRDGGGMGEGDEGDEGGSSEGEESKGGGIMPSNGSIASSSVSSSSSSSSGDDDETGSTAAGGGGGGVSDSDCDGSSAASSIHTVGGRSVATVWRPRES